MPPLHPIVIHFPVALFLVFVLFDFSLFIVLMANKEKRLTFQRKNSKLSPANEIILVLSIVGAWTAVVTGLLLKDEKSAFLPDGLVHLHEILAIVFNSCITLLPLFRFRRLWRPSFGYIFCLLICTALLFAVGHTGGEMVWQPAQASVASGKAAAHTGKKKTATKSPEQKQKGSEQKSEPKTAKGNHQKSGSPKANYQGPPHSNKGQAVQFNRQEYALGRKIFRQSCSSCHGLNVSIDRVGQYDANQWKQVVQNMQAKAGGTIPHTKAIVYYLAHLKQHQ
ncbi:MAG TPA: DUF2231 domain-containing protein [Bacillales bacterium]|nr:DUF2231 domain-containing protein [Bacillales bacterium]